MAHEIRTLDSSSIQQLQSIIERDPVRHCYVAARIAAIHGGFFRNPYSDFLGYFDDGHLKSALVLGANVVPVNTSTMARQEFAQVLRRQGRRCSSIVGPQEEVSELWRLLNDSWGPARAVRDSQLMMSIDQRSNIEPDDLVRYSTVRDLEALFPACVDMFTHEVGKSPVAHGGGPAYRNRINELISSRRSFIRTNGEQIIFKAEVGSLGAGVAQIQGVWVHPDYRGKGLAAPAMASVVRFILDDLAPNASLYVNDFNFPAIATYKRVGFQVVDTFSTVLF